MRSMNGCAGVLVLAVFVILVGGCSKKAIVPESEFDSIAIHYDQGMRELKAGNYNEARWEFERANGINDKHPMPYVGLALVEMNFDKQELAMKYAEKAMDKAPKCIEAFIARAKIRSYFKKDDWYKEAMKDLERAAEINPKMGKIYYNEGIVHEIAFNLDSAEKAFIKVLEVKNGFEENANLELEKITKIKRAAPGSKLGIKIGLVEKISRAETAVLFIEELKIIELFERENKVNQKGNFVPPDSSRNIEKVNKKIAPVDIDQHWAANYIKSILNVGIRGLDLYPDKTFKPNEYLTRAEYALIIEDLLDKLIVKEDLSRKYIGQPSPFPDLGSAHFAFNAACVCVDKGVMKADLKNNYFHPNNTVSGADALLIIKSMQDELRTIF